VLNIFNILYGGNRGGFPQGGAMDEKLQENHFCYNIKLPDDQCYRCIWLEWSENTSNCLNRKRMICSLYIEEVFGDFIPKTVN
jgi:hypothetical protein